MSFFDSIFNLFHPHQNQPAPQPTAQPQKPDFFHALIQSASTLAKASPLAPFVEPVISHPQEVKGIAQGLGTLGVNVARSLYPEGGAGATPQAEAALIAGQKPNPADVGHAPSNLDVVKTALLDRATLGKGAIAKVVGGAVLAKTGTEQVKQLPQTIEAYKNAPDAATKAQLLTEALGGLALTGLAAHGLGKGLSEGAKNLKKGSAYLDSALQARGAVPESGYLHIPGLEGATPEEYRAEIKNRVAQEAIYFAENEKNIRDNARSFDGGNKVVSETKRLFKEFQKDPDKFVDKYKLLPPDKVTAPETPTPTPAAPTTPQVSNTPKKDGLTKTPGRARQITKAANQGADVSKAPKEAQGKTLYRGINEQEWSALQKGGTSRSVNRPDEAFIGTDKDLAVMAAEAQGRRGRNAYIVEYKPGTENKITRGGSAGHIQNPNNIIEGEYLGKNLGKNDIARVTDMNGRVVYESPDLYNQAHTPQVSRPVATTKTPPASPELQPHTPFLDTVAQNAPQEIYHSSQVPVEQIKAEGFKPGKNSAFGRAAFFTDSNNFENYGVDTGEGNNVLKVNPADFKIKEVGGLADQQKFIKEQGAKDLAGAIKKAGYDGFKITNPDPSIGTTYGIVNVDKLNESIGAKPPITKARKASTPNEQLASINKQIREVVKSYKPGTTEKPQSPLGPNVFSSEFSNYSPEEKLAYAQNFIEQLKKSGEQERAVAYQNLVEKHQALLNQRRELNTGTQVKVVTDSSAKTTRNRTTPKTETPAAPTPIENITPEAVKRGSLEYVGSGIKQALSAGGQVNVPAEGVKANPIQRVVRYLTGKSPNEYKLTGDEINKSFDSLRREQQVIGQQVGRAITELAPSELDRQALTAIKELDGNIDKLRSYATNEKLPAKYREVAQRAVEITENPTQEQSKALKIISDYYKQTGQTLKDAEIIKGLKESYSNRIYEKATGANGEPAPALTQGTRHAATRKYDNPFDAALDGLKPNLDAGQLAHGYSDDIARVVPNRIVINSLNEQGFGKYVKPGEVPEGWTTVPGTERHIPFTDKEGNAQVKSSVFAVPEELAAAIKPIVSPDYFKKIDVLNKAQEINALAKFGKLGWSLFHWYNEIKELVGQTKVVGLPEFAKLAKSGDINQMERFVSKYGVTLETSPDAQINILDRVRQSGGALGKLTKIPGVKQALDLAQKNNEKLFQEAIPTMKTVSGFQQMMKWIDKHPNSSEAEVNKALRGIARQVNASHGGINWTDLGKDPSANSLARFSLLAYDWTYSNWEKAKLALTPDIRAAGPNAARVSVAASLVAGYITFRALNQLLNNGETDPGHEHEVKVGNTYISTYPASVTDALKLWDKTQQRGIIGGPASFVAGKLSPVGQAVVGLLSNTNQFGAPITSKGNSQFDNAKSALGFVGGTVSPAPLSASESIKTLSQPGANPVSLALSATGLGRTPTPKRGRKGRSRVARGRSIRTSRSRIGTKRLRVRRTARV